MENLRPRRSKITSIADRSSEERFASTERAFRGGNRQVKKQKNFPKLASDSSSCSSGSTGDDSFTFELGRRSSKQVVGTPIKKLLAEEMLRETEPRRRSPSVIAKLMGLDGLPPQQPAHRQQKSISENCLQRTRLVEKEERSSMCYDRRSSRKNSKEQQEFKDVFEVFEASKVEGRSCSSRGNANSKLSDAEMAFVRQKFMDAKRLSTDERLQDSKEFHDALEVLDSNKDLLLKFLQQPDSLFAKHLHDLQGGPHSRCGHIASMKSSEAQRYENIDLGWTAVRETPRKNNCKSPQEHRDSFSSHSDSRHAGHSSLKSSINLSEVKNESSIPPTRIVVLKPNLGKMLNGTKTISSPCSSHASMLDGRKHAEFPSIRNRETESRGRKNSQDKDGHLRHKSRESREVAKEITRQMRNNFSTGSVRFSSSGLKGYAGDESSCSMSENESANESEVMSVASRHSFHLNNHSRPSSSCSTESTVSREAKKRLSERWKMTHKSQEVGVVSRGNTLAEMLAIPDKEMRAEKLNAMIGEAGFRDKFSTEDAPARCGGPLGISSRDGWKDGCINSLSRSKSLPSSSSAFGSYKTSMRRETIRDDRYLIPKETVQHERNQLVKGNLDLREGARKHSRSSNKRSYSSRSLGREAIDISPETHTTQSKDKTDFEENNQSQQNISVFESSPSNAADSSSASVKLVDPDASLPSETPDTFLPESSSHMLVEGDSSSTPKENLVPQEPSIRPPVERAVPSDHPVPGIESPARTKEADQPSPVSVLEVPFTDDASSSPECFESLNADLQGLRMQLQLLKLESEPYAEGPMEISSDEEVGEESTGFSDAIGLHRDQGSWESSYLADILTESGLNSADSGTFLTTWHTPECPVSPLLFEELEKKYPDQTSWPKPERRLLFDRINSGLLEMFEQFTDPHPWVRPANKRVGPKWIHRSVLHGVLCKLLASQEENANEDNLEKVLERDSLWLDLGDDIDIIGREVENSLIDELVAEVVVM
ncbi:PREDICTED: B456_004G223300 [Prunus dulcis]|uniref:PREDICTED: B456_004G223300 n=1 Tax=Prunus dulcis TaxID=3755 RepID=A0A5E4F9T8_PRUDU|nr:uncharacterized protein LOC117632885 [Prunus dulcis]KAI5325537.1 hypothetical protein L3X38_034611 [Prunus dulcis]VVA22558.1 PREDICTED: B456_004G223300 [Prunus dulcis]